MRALTYHGQGDVRVDTHPDPKILYPTDCIVKITSTAICGSDLHLYDGFVPMMKAGDIIGHEPMGVVVEVGSQVQKLKVGDRVVVPFTISCGSCWFCEQTMYSLCDTSNPKPENAIAQMGHAPAGIFGYSHLTGGIPGGQAELLRVPHADVGPIKVPDGLSDEQVLFLSDIFPTGYMAAENAEIAPGDTVAVWGCGPVGQFAIQSAWMMGAGRVIAIDQVPERLEMARTHGKAETIDFSDDSDGSVYDRLQAMTKGRGPDRAIDAVGAELHASNGLATAVDALETDSPQTDLRLPYSRDAIMSVRKGGTISVPSVSPLPSTLPFGAAMNKGLTFKMGQTPTCSATSSPCWRRLPPADRPELVITHTRPTGGRGEDVRHVSGRKEGVLKWS